MTSGGGNHHNSGSYHRKNYHSNNNHNNYSRHAKRAKFDSSSSNNNTSTTPRDVNSNNQSNTASANTASTATSTAKVMEPEFQKLDQSDPVHARRIQQRRRMVAFGKNTVGYDEYIQQVPKHKRRPRCMKHPMTPDHTLDIPTKRWQGLVKAWRRALHQYDPEDLATSFSAESSTNNATGTAATVTPMPTNGEACTTNIQEQQLADAAAQGLQVNLANSIMSPSSSFTSRIVSTSPTSIETEANSSTNSIRDEGMDELDAWETGLTEQSDDDRDGSGLAHHDGGGGDNVSIENDDDDVFLWADDSDDELL